MALSLADFYAFSRATGVPVPEDPEDRAQMAPDVIEFRRNQLKAPESELVVAGLRGFGPYKNVNPAELEQRRQELMVKAPEPESNPLAALGAAALGLGALAGIGFGARRMMRPAAANKISATAGTVKTDLTSGLETARRYAPAPVAPKPRAVASESKIAPPPAAVQPATVDIDDVLREIRTKSPEPRAEFDVNKFLEENEGLYRRLVNAEDIKEKRVLGEQFLGQLRSGQVPDVPAPATTLPTRANQPGQFSDLTSIQNELLNQARNEQARVQQVNAVASSEDQVAQRTRSRTMSLRRSAKTQTSPILAKLYDAGLDEFEINARINAYSQYGKAEFLDPGYNAATVGPENFARTLEVASPEFDRTGRLIGGEYAGGTRTVYAGGEQYAQLPEGETKRSAFASQQPKPIRTRGQEGDESWEPISEALTGLTGGVSTAAVPLKQSEQFEQAINNFRGHWDEQLNIYLSGGRSSITRPARQNRLVDSFDLDLPVRLQKTEGLNEQGDLVARTETVLYRDILPPNVVEDIERGVPTNLDVPFLVNKNRAIAIAEAYPTIQNRLDAEHYKATGRALVRAHEKIVGPYINDKYVADLEPAGYFTTTESLSQKARPDVTPEKGPGSQKGRLVGGEAEPAVWEPVYNLQYHPHTTTEGRTILVAKTPVLTDAGTLDYIGITDLTQLNEIGVARDPQGAELYVSPRQQIDFITTQPMAVKRPLKRGAPPVGQITRQGKYGKFTSDVYEAAETIVQAPLQVLNAETGESISNTAQIRREELAGFLNGLRHASGVKDYAELGTLANRYLAEQKGITLPVLDSPTAFDFIEGVIGRPGSRVSRKSFVTVNQKTGDVYPLSREEAQSLGFSGGSVADPTQGRKYVGPPSLDIREGPKSLESWARMGESEGDWEQIKDFGEEGLGLAGMSPLQPRATGPLQRQMAPATKGPGAELQALREQLAKIKATQPKVSSEPLPSNLEVVTQQLLAQTGRRAGKRRNR